MRIKLRIYIPFLRDVALLSALSLLLPLVARAQAFAPLVDTGANKLQGLYSDSASLTSYVSGMFKVALSVGAILAVLRIAWAGYQYMASDTSWGSKSRAKETLGDIVLGLVLLIGVALILYQINPEILNVDTFLSGFSAT